MFITRLALAAAAVLGSLFVSARQADAVVTSAGTLFVDLDARHASAGTAAWTNAGSLGGSFTEFGNPTVTLLGPSLNQGVTFDGMNDYYRGANAPAGLTGAGAAGTRSVEVWVYNPSIPTEEAMVSLSRRGGAPDGSNVSFNYGSDATFGAVGQWGAPDIGWNGAPAAGQWHHLAYTYDGTTTRVYADGVLKNSEVNGSIDAHDNINMLIAAEMDPDGTTVTGAFRGSLSIANVRIHDGVLSAAEVAGNYVNDDNRFGINTPFSFGSLKHRYSFDGTGGNGATIVDSVSGANGVLRAADASALTGGQVDLGGGSSATAGYVDLPNGIVSSLTNATFEAWVTADTLSGWMRIFDFGDNDAGEIVGPGGSFGGQGAGADGYLFLTPFNGATGQIRTGIFEPSLGENFTTAGLALPTGSEQMLAVVFDDTNDLLTMYLNGQVIGTLGIGGRSLSQVLDVNNWLGRANFSGDPNFDGRFNEFRIYSSALSQAQIVVDFGVGPNALEGVPEPSSLVLVALAGTAMLARCRRERRNKKGISLTAN